MTYHSLGMQLWSILGHYFLCVEGKTVDRRWKRTKKHTTACKLLDFLSAKQKNISHIQLWLLNLIQKYYRGVCYGNCHYLYPCAPSVSLYEHISTTWFKLLPPCISFPLTSDPAASTLQRVFSVTIWISLSPCIAILNPKSLHHQSPGLGLLLFPDTSNLLITFSHHFSLS